MRMLSRPSVAGVVMAIALGLGGSAGCTERKINGHGASEFFLDPRVAALARAACENDRAAVSRALAAGASPNAQGRQGVTPLLWAENCDNPAGMEALLLAGANPNYVVPGEDGGFTPVAQAAGMKNPEILRVLLRHGGDPNAIYQDRSALRYAIGSAVASGDWSNYYSLLHAHADVNLLVEGQSAPEFAATMAQYDKVLELLDLGYTHDLERLGAYVQATAIGPSHVEALAARAKVVKRLESLGVKFPVPPLMNRVHPEVPRP